MPGQRARSGVGKYNAESPKQGSKRFNFIMKTTHFAYLGILFIYELPHPAGGSESSDQWNPVAPCAHCPLH